MSGRKWPARRGWHPSIRLRLTVSYTLVLVVASAVLLALNYAVLYSRLYSTLRPIAVPLPPAEKAQLTQSGLTGESATRNLATIEAAVRVQARADTLLYAGEMSAIALAVMAVLGLGVAWLLAGRMLRPLQTLTATARRISQDRLHERIALGGPRDEVTELADTFDAMVARLESAFGEQRRFAADASHELRTPLAIARTSVEVMLGKPRPTPEQWRAMGERVLAATARAERLLDGLLALSRSEHGATVHDAHDLAVAASFALADVDRDATTIGLAVRSELRSAPVAGDRTLIDGMVANLVDNAIRHNQPGGWVAVESGARDGRSFVTVSNSGDVIDPADAERLFEPFRRRGAGRTGSGRGSGLGLAIVRSIVNAHHGAITATPSPDGGMAVTVSLPEHRDVAAK